MLDENVSYTVVQQNLAKVLWQFGFYKWISQPETDFSPTRLQEDANLDAKPPADLTKHLGLKVVALVTVQFLGHTWVAERLTN